MVTKKKQGSTEKRGKKKISNLKLNKETVKDLSESEAEKIQGGLLAPKGIFCKQQFGDMTGAPGSGC